jgi:transaldolase
MIKEGEELADLHEQIVVKLPMTKEGVMAAKYFLIKELKRMLLSFCRSSFIGCRCYLCFSFIGRLDVSTDGLALIEEIRLIYDNYGYETQILAASVVSHNAYCELC